jgi:LacI family transcriptional regulator
MPITEDRVRRFMNSRLPIILVDCFHQEFDSVSVNNEIGGYLATRHFIEQGRRRIGMVTASAGRPALERRQGYERALREAGLAIDESLVKAGGGLQEHGYTEKAGYDAMNELLQRRPLPDAVFATSDVQALGAMRAIKDAGLKVPEDVAIIGFDDIVVSKYVGLSTLRQPMREIGELAVDKFLHRLQHPDHPVSHTVFAPRLVLRDTSGTLLSDSYTENAVKADGEA